MNDKTKVLPLLALSTPAIANLVAGLLIRIAELENQSNQQPSYTVNLADVHLFLNGQNFQLSSEVDSDQIGDDDNASVVTIRLIPTAKSEH